MNVSPSVYTNVGIKFDMDTVSLKGTATLMTSMFYQKELYGP